MLLLAFRILNFRNIIDSQWIKASKLRALIAQNECGKSNLLRAFYLFSPYEKDAKYNLSEDWPADKWPPGAPSEVVCQARFKLTEENIESLYAAAPAPVPQPLEGEQAKPIILPSEAEITVSRNYGGHYGVDLPSALSAVVNAEKATAWVVANLPKCVYMDDYMAFNGHAHLDTIAQKLAQHGQNRSVLSEEEQTVMIILDLAQINIQDLMGKGSTHENRTVRGFDTVRASAYLTKQFARLWKQKEIKFDIRVDSTTLDILVEDVGLGMPIRLKNRSRGFQWYVSFIWRFSHASKGEFKNCILLLDEPGVHLHPAGHRDLLPFLEELSQSNTVFYTTHLSSLIDLAYPERLMIMEIRDHHATVKEGMFSSQPAPMMVIEQALGLSPSMSGLLGIRQNLVVEGGEDAVVLQKLSGILAQSGDEGLSDRIYLLPAHGAPKTPMFAGFLVGNKLDAAVLLDSDPAGLEAKKKIQELFLKGLSDENESRFRILMLGESAGIKQNEAAIEDLFPVDFFLECVNEAYRISIRESDLPTDGSDQICKRVERVLIDRGAAKELEKKRVLSEILKRFESMRTKADLPKGTYDKAKKLISAINKAFGHVDVRAKTASAQSKHGTERVATHEAGI